MSNYLSILYILLYLSQADLNGQELPEQTFFKHRHSGLSLGYGPGKIQWYSDFTPLAPIRNDPDVRKYSPSWQINYSSAYWLSKQFDIAFEASHTTLTERSDETPLPGWEGYKEKHLVQSFIHITPMLIFKSPRDQFNIHLGLCMGTANFIFNDSRARENSNSWGDLDFCLDIGYTLKLSKKIFFQNKWMEGLTRYDYFKGLVGGTTIDFYDYFKYRTFLFNLIYRWHEL